MGPGWRSRSLRLVVVATVSSGLHPLYALERPSAATPRIIRHNEHGARVDSRLSVALRVRHEGLTEDVLFSDNRARCDTGLPVAQAARGGSTKQRHRRARRPLRRFCAPALVWVVAAMVEYNLWWTLGPAAAACLRDNNNALRHGVGEAWAANTGHFVCFHVLLGLALLSHVAVTVADPGLLPRGNPWLVREQARQLGGWCVHCDAFKPPRAHHCRRCGSCVARMDHHCIYAANCVGAGNHKQFILLLLYSAACAAHANLLYFRFLGCSSGDASSSKKSITVERLLFLTGLGVSEETDGALSTFGGERFSWCWRAKVWAGGLLPVVSVVVFTWLAILLIVQLYGVAVDAGTVDRMQAASAARVVAVVSPMEPRGRAWWGENSPPSPIVEVSSFSFPKKQSAGNDLLQDVEPAAGKYTSCSTSSVRRPAAARGLQRVLDSRRGPLGSGAAAVVAADDDDCRDSLGVMKEIAFCVGRWWRTLRVEVLGDGPWVMWFVPLPAKFAPEVKERVYGTQQR